MSTLGGLFGTQPRCKRNFLLENIRDVRKERLKKKSGNIQGVKLGQCTRKVPQPISKSSTHQTSQLKGIGMSPSKSKTSTLTNLHRKDTSEPKHRSDNGSQTTCQQHSLCRQKEGSGIINCSREDIIPFKYIDEENVPFRWTQVCPSVLSHTVCHQSVQTLNEDDLDSLLEDGSIKYPSSDKTSGNIRDENVTLLEWPVNADEGTSSPPGRDISSGSIQSHSKSNGLALNLPVDDRSSAQQNLIFQDKRNTVSETTEMHPVTIDHGAISSAPRYKSPTRSHYPFSSKPNGETTTRRYRSQNIENKNLRIDESDSSQHNHRGKEQSLKPMLQLRDEIENLEITSLKSNGLPSRPPKSHQKGIIPKYLAKRINEQKAVSKTTESEEVNTLEMQRRIALQEATAEYDALIAELNKMPVRTDTLRTKQRKIEIEKELNVWESRIRSLTRVSDF